jgi:hypothetical protein
MFDVRKPRFDELVGMTRSRHQTISVLEDDLNETPPDAASASGNQPDF